MGSSPTDRELSIGPSIAVVHHPGEAPLGRAIALDVEPVIHAVEVAELDHVLHLAEAIELGERRLVEPHRC